MRDNAKLDLCGKNQHSKCTAFFGRAENGSRRFNFLAVRCQNDFCIPSISYLSDFGQRSVISKTLDRLSDKSTVFISTGGMYAVVNNTPRPDGLLIVKGKVVSELTEFKNGTEIATGGIFTIHKSGHLSIIRITDFKDKYKQAASDLDFAIQSTTILVSRGNKDSGLSPLNSPPPYSDRSAVGIGRDGSFMFFMAVTTSNTAGKPSRHDALTLDQFAELIVLMGNSLGSAVDSAMNLEGYSYPFAIAPRAQFSLGLDEKKMMSNAFQLKLRNH